MYGWIGSEWNERTNSSLLSWKDKIFRLFRGPISSEALPSPPCFLFWETLYFIGVLIFCAGNYRVFSWGEICFLMDADLRSSMENLSFTNWRRGRSEGRRFLAGIKWRMDFLWGIICICISSVFYLCICCVSGDLGHGFRVHPFCLGRELYNKVWVVWRSRFYLIHIESPEEIEFLDSAGVLLGV